MTTSYDDDQRTPIAIDSSGLQPGRRIVVMVWSTEHGACNDCGLPAAYVEASTKVHLCSVCAAQAAADGATISRLFVQPEANTGVRKSYAVALWSGSHVIVEATSAGDALMKLGVSAAQVRQVTIVKEANGG